MGFVVRVLLRLLRWTGRSRQDLILENLAVRHPIAGLERTARRPALRDRARRLGSLLAQEWMGWRPPLPSVQPATVVGGHRTAWRRYGRWTSRGRRPGRPRLDQDAVRLLLHHVRAPPHRAFQRDGCRATKHGSSGSGPFVAMLEASQHRGRDDALVPLWRARPGWRMEGEGPMGTRLVVIGDALLDDPLQGPRGERNAVMQALASERPDPALGHGIRVRSLHRCPDRLTPKPLRPGHAVAPVGAGAGSRPWPRSAAARSRPPWDGP